MNIEANYIKIKRPIALAIAFCLLAFLANVFGQGVGSAGGGTNSRYGKVSNPEGGGGGTARKAGDGLIGITGTNPKAASAPVVPFAPTDLSGLVGWYKSGVGITLNGGTVSQWDDSSGTGNHASHGTAGNQPTYNATDVNFNGLASLTFDGTSDLLFANGLLSSIINGTDKPMTVVMACKPVLTAAFPTAMGTNFDPSGETQFRIRFRNSAVSTFYMALRDAANNDVSITGGTSTATTQIVRWQSSGTAAEVFSNNASVASGAFDVGACNATWFALGATPTAATTGANFYGGEIAEIAIYSRLLTVGEQAQVETYFKNKFAAY